MCRTRTFLHACAWHKEHQEPNWGLPTPSSYGLESRRQVLPLERRVRGAAERAAPGGAPRALFGPEKRTGGRSPEGRPPPAPPGEGGQFPPITPIDGEEGAEDDEWESNSTNSAPFFTAQSSPCPSPERPNWARDNCSGPPPRGPLPHWAAPYWAGEGRRAPIGVSIRDAPSRGLIAARGAPIEDSIRDAPSRGLIGAPRELIEPKREPLRGPIRGPSLWERHSRGLPPAEEGVIPDPVPAQRLCGACPLCVATGYEGPYPGLHPGEYQWEFPRCLVGGLVPPPFFDLGWLDHLMPNPAYSSGSPE